MNTAKDEKTKLNDDDLKLFLVYLYNGHHQALLDPETRPNVEVTLSEALEHAREWAKQAFR